MAGAARYDITSSLSQSSEEGFGSDNEYAKDWHPSNSEGDVDRQSTVSTCTSCSPARSRSRDSASGSFLWSPPATLGAINMLDVPWFHPNLTRHQAEAELRNSEEGVYLLRPRVGGGELTTNGYSLDVRSAHVVKHFKLDVIKGKIEFGQESFDDTESFIAHFDQCPLIGDDTGHLLIFKYPYPRDIEEIHDYQFVTEHFVPGNIKRPSITLPRVHSLVSKEGYLVKLGAVVKSWKTRWFVLKDNELKYFSKPKSKNAIRTIELKEVSEVTDCDMPNKQNIFSVVCPQRTFFLQAPSRQAKDEWMDILQWRLKQLRERERGNHVTNGQVQDNGYTRTGSL